MQPKNTGFYRVYKATIYSMQGIRSAYKHEAAFRQEIWLLLAGIPLGLWLGDNGVEKVLMIGTLLLLTIVELMNSAVEAAIDRISYERHELSGRAKDFGSAAVFFTLILIIFTWTILLLD